MDSSSTSQPHLEAVRRSRYGRQTVAILVENEKFATVHVGRLARLGLGRAQVVLHPRADGGIWSLPMPPTIDALENAREQLGLEHGPDMDRPNVVCPWGTGPVRVELDNKLWATVHRDRSVIRVEFARQNQSEILRLPLRGALSALRRALSMSHAWAPWTPTVIADDDFCIVSSRRGADVLVDNEKWVAAPDLPGSSRWGPWVEIPPRSDLRHWVLPFEAALAALAELGSVACAGERASVRAAPQDADVDDETRMAVYAITPENRERRIAIIEVVGYREWAELNEEGPELQLVVYSRTDGQCWRFPLGYMVARLLAAKRHLLGDAERPPIRRPVVSGRRRDAASSEVGHRPGVDGSGFLLRPLADDWAILYNGGEFATAYRHGGSPLLRLSPPPTGRWTLPPLPAIEVLEEVLRRFGLRSDGAKPRANIVVCTEATASHVVVEVRFASRLRAELARHGRGLVLELAADVGNARAWRLPLIEVVLTLRWALSVLHAAGPSSPSEATLEDFSVAAHASGERVLVAGAPWMDVGVDAPGADPCAALVGRTDLRPWKLPYEVVVATLAGLQSRLLAARGGAGPSEGEAGASDSVGEFDQYVAIRSDRERTVVQFDYRDGDGWTQWAELNQEGAELQVEMYSWPGRGGFVFPLREVVDQLRSARELLFGDDG